MPHMHTPSVRLVRPLANGMKSYVSKLILIRIPPLTWTQGLLGLARLPRAGILLAV